MKTLQLQCPRGQIYGNIPIHERILRTVRYARNIPKNARQNTQKHRQKIQLSRWYANNNKGFTQWSRLKRRQSPLETWQRKSGNQYRKVRIRKTHNNLACVQNYPNGIFPNSKKDRFDTQLKTPEYAQTSTLPYGLHTAAHKIYTKSSQPTWSNKTITRKRKHKS